MSIQITRAGKYSLFVDSPVMNAAGVAGFANNYRHLIDVRKLGAFVTNPVTIDPWSPATGTRVVPMDAGVLVHTGLPNQGLSKVIKEYDPIWHDMGLPIILHIVGTTTDHITTMVRRLDRVDSVAAIELGLDDDITWEEAEALTLAATNTAEKPVLVRLPAFAVNEVADVVVDSGADALVVAAPPRGTARDPRSGKLVSGRVYGPLVKPMILRLVGSLARRITDVPIIGAGGIHSSQDARDYIEAGARAVQVDSVTWMQPQLLERIARDLGGNLVTRAMDAFPDEWHPDMGDTEFHELFGVDDDETPKRNR